MIAASHPGYYCIVPLLPPFYQFSTTLLPILPLFRLFYYFFTISTHSTPKQNVGVIEISGRAAPAVFQSKPSGYEPNNYLIEWTAVSHTRVFKFELLYR